MYFVGKIHYILLEGSEKKMARLGLPHFWAEKIGQ